MSVDGTRSAAGIDWAGDGLELRQVLAGREGARTHPVAGQLRYLLVCTHVTSQLERIGDQALNICEALDMMTSDPATHPTLPKLQQMADLVSEMVRDALNAYFDKDAEKAEQTRTHDDAVDALNDQIVRELFTDEVLREVLAGAQDIADAVAQILISRNMERIADQATNICKEVVYMVRGDDVRHIHDPGQPPA